MDDKEAREKAQKIFREGAEQRLRSIKHDIDEYVYHEERGGEGHIMLSARNAREIGEFFKYSGAGSATFLEASEELDGLAQRLERVYHREPKAPEVFRENAWDVIWALRDSRDTLLKLAARR